ncbi:hypothetical protein T310_6665, partial [Rasamsonia emersonii CBS 393.64]
QPYLLSRRRFGCQRRPEGCLESLAHRTAPHQGQQWGQPTGGVLLSGGLARDSPGGQRVWPQLSSSRCQGAALGGRDRRDQPVPYPARLWYVSPGSTRRRTHCLG